MGKTMQHEVMQAPRALEGHERVMCAKCRALVSGPGQFSGLAKGKGEWQRECSACGTITRYDVEM